MIGKIVKFAVGTRESWYKLNKKLTEVEMYIDGESGTLYIVPKEDRELKEGNPFLKNIGELFWKSHLKIKIKNVIIFI